MNVRHYRWSVWVGLLAVLLLAACAGGAAPEADTPDTTDSTSERTDEEAAPASEDDPLVVLIDNDEGPLTPANYNTFIGLWMTGWVYDPLFTRTPDLELVPALATEATQSEDALSWDIALRDDVTWHDGEPFTAEDVVFSYNFLKAAGWAPNLGAVVEVEATGEHSVRLTLSDPAPFLQNEGLAQYYIMPEHIWRDQEPVEGEITQFDARIGTGAYRLAAVDAGESYTFEANPDYFRGAPQVGTIIARVVTDRTQQFTQLRAGEADAVLSSVPPAQVEGLQQDEAIDLAQGSDFFNYIFYMNGSKPPFDDVEVRRAIASAIDTATLVEVVLLGQGVQLPLSWYHPDIPWSIGVGHTYDPEGARALLEAAGYTDSDQDGIREMEGAPMAFEILCDTNNPVEVRATELIAGWLQEVGIGASQRCLDIDTAVTFIWPNFISVPDPEYDMAIWGWSGVPQFQRGFIRGMIHSDFGNTGWANLTGNTYPALEALVDDYVSSTDPAEVERLNQEIQETFAATLPWVPLMSPRGNFAYRPAAYDGWAYMRGTGIVPVWSLLPESARP